MPGRIRRFLDEWRPSAVTAGAPAYPLLVLFGLNAVDELDRTAFGVLLPDIRDHFGLSNAEILGVELLEPLRRARGGMGVLGGIARPWTGQSRPERRRPAYQGLVAAWYSTKWVRSRS